MIYYTFELKISSSYDSYNLNNWDHMYISPHKSHVHQNITSNFFSYSELVS